MSELVLATALIEGPEARGMATLLRREDGRAVLRLTDYWIAPGAPDVHVYLTPAIDGDVDAAGTADFGPITQLQGNQNLTLPPNVEVDHLRTVVVFCKVYSVEFGRGTLSR